MCRQFLDKHLAFRDIILKVGNTADTHVYIYI